MTTDWMIVSYDVCVECDVRGPVSTVNSDGTVMCWSAVEVSLVSDWTMYCGVAGVDGCLGDGRGTSVVTLYDPPCVCVCEVGPEFVVCPVAGNAPSLYDFVSVMCRCECSVVESVVVGSVAVGRCELLSDSLVRGETVDCNCLVTA